MKKRILSVLLAGCMAAALFAGCGGKSSSAENGELNLFIWTEYVPDAIIEKFEKDYGIKVNVTTFSSNEDMLAKVKSESEGADNWAIAKGAKNYDNAMKFINFMCDPEVAGMVMEEFPYLNCNQTAVEANEDYASNEAKNVPAEVFEAGERDKVLDNDTIAIYDNMWTELKQ